MTAYPLFWPAGRPRCQARRTNRQFRASFADARDECLREIRRLGGSDAVLSTNIKLRRDGVAYAVDFGKSLPDPGVAVYFKRKAKELCFACDCWWHVQDNMHAICLTIAALRGIARWGTGDMMEAAFTGFLALPAPGESSGVKWWQVLGVPLDASPAEAREAYRLLALRQHPDKGGNVEGWLRLQEAWDQFSRIERNEYQL